MFASEFGSKPTLLEMFMKKGKIHCINDSMGSLSWLSVQIMYFGEHVELGKILDQTADQKDGWRMQPGKCLTAIFLPLHSSGVTGLADANNAGTCYTSYCVSRLSERPCVIALGCPHYVASVSTCTRKSTIRLTTEAIHGLRDEVSDHLLALEATQPPANVCPVG